MHKLLVHRAEPGVLFQQNHVGVYRTADYGDSWQRIDAGLPYDFGFGLALHPRNPHVCYVIPLEPHEYMFRATDGALGVYRSSSSSPKSTVIRPSSSPSMVISMSGLAWSNKIS